MRWSRWAESGCSIRVTVGATFVEPFGSRYGSMDEEAIGSLRATLLRLAEVVSSSYLVLDLSRVEYLGARLVGALVSIGQRLRHRHRRFAICGLSPSCSRLARMLELHSLFEIFPTQRAALLAIATSVPSGVKPGGRGLRIALSDVSWDASKLRLEYLSENGSKLYTRIVPRES